MPHRDAPDLDQIPPEEGSPIVLCIDDSRDALRLIECRLRSEEFRIEQSTSAEQGLEMVRTLRPSLVLLDLDMPGVDGFEVLRTLKADPATMRIPVIILSALQGGQDKVVAYDLGADDFLCKPFDPTELRVRIRYTLRMRRLLELLAQRAHIDGLTGLWNRAHFDQRWTEEVSRAVRHARPLSLAMLDIDHFKSVNDLHGHPAGDAVLEAVARLIRRECRTSDVPCRYGGEEFALIMPDTGPLDARTLCERIRLKLAETVWPRHREHRVTISIGLVGSQGHSRLGASEWIEAADHNLYRSKHEGRDRTTMTELEFEPRLAAG